MGPAVVNNSLSASTRTSHSLHSPRRLGVSHRSHSEANLVSKANRRSSKTPSLSTLDLSLPAVPEDLSSPQEEKLGPFSHRKRPSYSSSKSSPELKQGSFKDKNDSPSPLPYTDSITQSLAKLSPLAHVKESRFSSQPTSSSLASNTNVLEPTPVRGPYLYIHSHHHNSSTSSFASNPHSQPTSPKQSLSRLSLSLSHSSEATATPTQSQPNIQRHVQSDMVCDFDIPDETCRPSTPETCLSVDRGGTPGLTDTESSRCSSIASLEDLGVKAGQPTLSQGKTFSKLTKQRSINNIFGSLFRNSQSKKKNTSF